MSKFTNRLDPNFLKQQRDKLTRMRQEILSAKRSTEIDLAEAASETIGQARDYEDDAQKLMSMDIDTNLAVTEQERLADIERALQKIDDGTYGLSDKSGTPIPLERLEAMPEALYTIEERSDSKV
jgi:DnaK suppressor protein